MGPRSHGNRDLRFSAHGVIPLRGAHHSAGRITIDTNTPSRRRGFITKLAHSGISSKVIMELAGHKHLGTTQRYIYVNDEMKRAAVAVV